MTSEVAKKAADNIWDHFVFKDALASNAKEVLAEAIQSAIDESQPTPAKDVQELAEKCFRAEAGFSSEEGLDEVAMLALDDRIKDEMTQHIQSFITSRDTAKDALIKRLLERIDHTERLLASVSIDLKACSNNTRLAMKGETDESD